MYWYGFSVGCVVTYSILSIIGALSRSDAEVIAQRVINHFEESDS